MSVIVSHKELLLSDKLIVSTCINSIVLMVKLSTLLVTHSIRLPAEKAGSDRDQGRVGQPDTD